MSELRPAQKRRLIIIEARLVHAGVVNGISECLHGFREIEAGFRAVMLSRRSSMTPAWDSVVKIG